MAFPTRPRDMWFSAIIAALLIIGIAFLVANVPNSPYRNPNTPLFLTYILSVIIALVAYIRFANPVVWWEVVLLAAWGEFSLFISGIVSFLVMLGMPPASIGYPGVIAEFAIHLGIFLTATMGLLVPYAMAGKYRQDSVRDSMMAAGIALVVLVIILPTVSYVLPLLL